ncbi:Amidase 1 [Acorus gramineus]|uniref:Amidase 1 n=1 Tax=Acorus gramineus TaxID=55184 RepID=A0AAV9BRS9_ACOGR|nr:Amidase 1 [Acorus gramineus]
MAETEVMKNTSNEDFGAFVDKFLLLPPSDSPHHLPLSGLTFAVKDIFDVEGHVTGFGNLDWARTHSAAASTAPVVSDILSSGASSVGKTVMDEMAYSINGENWHYGTPTNPCAPDRVPGGSSSGSAVAVAAGLVDFSLGTDTGGSVRVPGAFCGILGFRPSHGTVSTDGVIPMAQSFDTVGWFARDPLILNKVGHVLLRSPVQDPLPPCQIIIPDDCFQNLCFQSNIIIPVVMKTIENLFSCQVIKHVKLGDYIRDNVPSLKHFTESESQEFMIPSLSALSNSLRLLQKWEFKKNHGEWVSTIRPHLGPGIHERVWDAIGTSNENVGHCHTVKTELRAALSSLIQDCGVLVLPTVPGPPPKLQTQPVRLENYRAKAFSLLAIAGMSGFCQVTIPLGMLDDLPVAVSLLARHGDDLFLLNLVQTLNDSLKEQASDMIKST